MSSPLRICIDARIRSGGSVGGIETLIIGLASGFSELTDGEEEYIFVAFDGHADWLLPHLSPPSRIELVPYAAELSRSRSLAYSIPGVRRAWHRFSPKLGRIAVPIRRSDGSFERFGADLVHFATQNGFLTGRPTIYHPHDLQHLHYPEYFTPHQRMKRNVLYQRFCEEAALVAVSSSWTREDVIRQYRLPSEKVRVIPLAPGVLAGEAPTEDELAATRKKFGVPEDFGFYAAQTWPHKNHLSLLEALARLRTDHGLLVPFVFSGRLGPFFSVLERRARELGIDDQVSFIGFVTELELRCLYHLCRCVTIPTKFESASFPLWEAFTSGAPVASSSVTALPKQAGGAALLFNPCDSAEIAEAVLKLWTDEGLRRKLSKRGREKVATFTWNRTARIFRAHYRRIAGKTLTDEDRALLTAPPPI